MPVVFVLPEKIRVGKAIALTAEGTPKSYDMAETSWKCHSDGAHMETYEVERGKPREWETQIMVGALSKRNWTAGGT